MWIKNYLLPMSFASGSELADLRLGAGGRKECPSLDAEEVFGMRKLRFKNG